ncbi:MAG: hypothetical protein AAFW97_14470 [Pseudomonadota bacterium]
MIRPATAKEVREVIIPMLVELQPQTIYRGRSQVDEDYAFKALVHFVQYHGRLKDGGKCLFVYEHDGEIVGFIAGLLSRVYNIGDKLVASDMFLHCIESAPVMAWVKLINAYMQWADSSPDVIDITLSHTEAMPGSIRLEPAFERMGFREFGKTYVKQVDKIQLKEAA